MFTKKDITKEDNKKTIKMDKSKPEAGDKKKIKFTLLNKKSSKSSSGNLIQTFLLALILAVLVRSFLFEPFHIPSGSMKPTLLIGDYVFVSKYSYGYSRYSFPFGLNIFKGRIFEGDRKPERGDIIVFRYPKNPKINYIKRLIGLPGDKIQMRDGVLFINNKAVSKFYKGNLVEIEDGEKVKLSKYEETLPNGKIHITLDHYQNSFSDDTFVFEVPEGHYFFMGDNRDHSVDSRFMDKVGFVPEENLVGKARIIFFSTSESFWKFWKWNSSIRWERILNKIK